MSAHISYHPLLFEGAEVLPSNHHMIQYFNPDDLSDLYQPLCQIDIVFGRRHVIG